MKMINSKNGYTLIEMLVVLLIIGIATSLVMLAVGDFGRSREMKNTAEEMAMGLRLARQEAIIQNMPYQFTVKNTQYYYQKFSKNKWQKVSYPIALTQKTLTNKIKLSLSKPIIFYPNGNLTPFTLWLGTESKPKQWIINNTQMGDITVVEQKPNE